MPQDLAERFIAFLLLEIDQLGKQLVSADSMADNDPEDLTGSKDKCLYLFFAIRHCEAMIKHLQSVKRA